MDYIIKNNQGVIILCLWIVYGYILCNIIVNGFHLTQMYTLRGG